MKLLALRLLKTFQKAKFRPRPQFIIQRKKNCEKYETKEIFIVRWLTEEVLYAPYHQFQG